ncbi:MAG: DUF4386 domain-containing protein [Spirochaetes bacterium]|nr:DUF4386 domain-containing protein [Spirochaetota bacterium]MBN2769067.1 DUF4386 domain-containing protein [Spirochaetota bacterium]
MNRISTKSATGLLSVISIFLAVGSMVYLEATFPWEGKNIEAILSLYYERGPGLRIAWFLFATGCMLIIPLSIFLYSFCKEKSSIAKTGCIFGATAGFCYMLGIMRWVIPVHYLSQLLHDSAGNEIIKQNIIISFNVLNSYAGNCFGETAAPLLHGFWLIIFGSIMHKNRIGWKWFGITQIFGGVIITLRPLEFTGMTTLGKMSDYGLILWSLTFLVFGTCLLFSKTDLGVDYDNK